LRLDRPVAPVLKALADQDILGGLDLREYRPDLGNALLVCATETKTEADIGAYVSAMRDVLQSKSRKSA
jgi:glycine dehydrogenase subunit 1